MWQYSTGAPVIDTIRLKIRKAMPVSVSKMFTVIYLLRSSHKNFETFRKYAFRFSDLHCRLQDTRRTLPNSKLTFSTVEFKLRKIKNKQKPEHVH